MDPDSRSFSLQKLGPDPQSEKLLGPDPQKMKKDPHLVLVPCFCLNVATIDFELARKYGFLFTVPVFTESYDFLRVPMILLDFFLRKFPVQTKSRIRISVFNSHHGLETK